MIKSSAAAICYLSLFIPHWLAPCPFGLSTTIRPLFQQFLAMEGTSFTRGARGRGGTGGRGTRGWNPSRNKHWSTTEGTGSSRSNTPIPGHGERWERGGHRGGGRGRGAPRGSPRKFPNVSLRLNHPTVAKQPAFEDNAEIQSDDNYEEYEEDNELHVEEQEEEHHEDEVNEEASADEEIDSIPEIHEPEFETAEEREKFYQEVRIYLPSRSKAADRIYSLSKPERLNAKRLSQKGRWTILQFPKDWRMPFPWWGRVFICALGLKGTDAKEKTIFLNGRP